jgi:hypothetical protein
MRLFMALLAASIVIAATPGTAFAWGLMGHKIIGEAAMARLPDELPAFLRTGAAKDEIIYLQSEEDRLKLGEADEEAWTREWTTDHYLDIGDDGMIGGLLSIDALPPTRDKFAEALEHASPSVDPYNVGFLPYAILEGYEQVRTDFALWRMATVAADHKEVAMRAKLVIHDIGIFSHFVGDGSQPLHVSVHYNGWGKYPNPNEFTESKSTHGNFEDTFVDRFTSLGAVTPLVGPAEVLPSIPLHDIETYLSASRAQVVPFYQLEKAGAFVVDGPNSPARAQGVHFAEERLAAASQMLDSLILTAWRTSAEMKPTD